MKDPDILIKCAISNLKRPHNHPRRYRNIYLWGLVSEVFGIGSTSAIELCKEHGFDPWEKLK